MVMAEKISLKDLEKLPPEKRVALLKKFEEQRKKEIEHAESLLKRSEKEIETRNESEREVEQKSKELLEKKIVETRGEELENIVEESQKTTEEEGAGVQYGRPLEELKKIYEIAPAAYEAVRELRNRASEGRLTREDEQRLNFYESEFSQISAVQAAYIKDEKTRVNVMKIKTALEQTEEYKTTMM